jgi:hypothetical protein
LSKTDLTQYKSQLEGFLERRGIEYNAKTKKWRCPNPGHADADPSCTLYHGEILNCNVCSDKAWDIFEVAGLLDNLTTFPDKLKAVQDTLGMPAQTTRKKSKNKTKHPPPVPLTREKAKDIFNPTELTETVIKYEWLNGNVEFVKVWPYFNADGLIELFDVRFENEKNKKAVITFYWDGKLMRSAGAPVLLYNRNLIANDPDTPVLIVEGAKTAEVAADIPGFIPVTWNGGGKKCKQVDWTILKGRTVYIYPDDDWKKYANNHPTNAGELKPWHQQPGMVTAFEIKKKLPQAKIVQPIESARKIKPDGADIVEVFQVPEMTPQTIADYIINSEEVKPPEPPPNPIDTPHVTPDIDVFPFRILGVADDGKAYFLDRHERMTSTALGSITQNKLLTLASLPFWKSEYATGKGGELDRNDWITATDDVIHLAGMIDFDPDRIRGRGAWRESDGRVCYHDGLDTIGEKSDERLYLRMTRKSIGLDTPLPELKALTAILNVTGQLSFETRADMIRCIAWSTLAPFAGALPWRPAGLLTGRSESGKSTIVDMIIKPLSLPLVVSGGESTEAGVRQAINIDSVATVVEESETDTPKKKQRREDILSLMRQSTSDETPKAVKGTIDGKGMRFTLRSMFIFVAISPEVESIADDNRMFRVNLEGKGHTPDEWYQLGVELKNAITPEICASIRALTWTRLKDIFAMAERMSPIIQKITGKSSRYSRAESLLFAAYHVIWKQVELSDNDITVFFEQIYKWQPVEAARNEEEELLDKLLDHIVREGRDTFTLRQVLLDCQKGITSQEKSVERYGMRMFDGDIAIAKNYGAISAIIDRGKGYQRMFFRHYAIKDESKNVKIAGAVRNCFIIDGSVLKGTEEDTF